MLKLDAFVDCAEIFKTGRTFEKRCRPAINFRKCTVLFDESSLRLIDLD